jgi:3-oxoacyl-[acyl-carrier protein] reductase
MLRTAIVTGAGQGIGAATAHRLARDGLRVGVLDLSEANATTVAKSIVEAGGTAMAVAADVRRANEVAGAVAEVAGAYGPPLVLVNNAGIARDNLMFRMSEDEWDDVLDVHLRGAFLMSRAVSPHMVDQRWGRIVNVSSTSAHGNRGQVNYATAKAGVHGLTKTMALELGPLGINVNAIAPGFVPTAMSEAAATRLGISHEEFQTRAAAGIALRRVGTPDDVAGVVSFLTGPDAAFVAGAIVYVAGGPWG